MRPFAGRLKPSAVALFCLAIMMGLLQLPAAPAQAASTITYTYEVRGRGNATSLEDFAALAQQTYAEPRGWALGGSIRFVRVPSGGNFTLWLSAASYLPGFSSGCSVQWSCRAGRNVIINETRFRGGTPSWNSAGGSLRDYQHMVVNHETGHWLGFGHSSCPGAGSWAPVMQQQSKSLQGCRFNAWPTAGERQRLSATKGVPIVVPPTGPPPVQPGAVTTIAVAGRSGSGVPADARAIGMNLTITQPTTGGYATVYPCGAAIPPTSNLNFAPGQTVAGFTLARTGTDGKVCVRSTAQAHLIVDVSGYVPAASSYQGVAPRRLLDSRTTGPRSAATRSVQLPAGAQAAGLTITVTEPAYGGFITVFPCGVARPLASTLNFVAGQTVANFTLASAGTDGKVCISPSAPAHVLVDLVGTLPTGSGFIAQAPMRLLDSRNAPIAAGVHTVALPAGGQHVLNLTVTGATGGGWARVHPCSGPPPPTSNINFAPGQTVANAVIAAGDATGAMCVTTATKAHVIVDDGGQLAATDYRSAPAVRLLDTRVR